MKKKLYLLFTIILTSSVYSQNIKTVTNESWSNKRWINSTYVIKSYNKNNNITDDLVQLWDLNSSKWNDFNLTNYEYNANSTLGKMISKTWNNASNSLVPFQRSSFNYNNEKRIDLAIHERWTNNVWENSVKVSSTYDANGHLTVNDIKMWEQNNWKNNQIDDYLYNSDGLTTQITRQKWNDSTKKWENFSQSTYTYTNAQKILVETMSIWENNKWIKRGVYTSSYDKNNFLTYHLHQDWDDALSIWVNQQQSTYTNNPNGTINQELVELWRNKLWENFYRLTYTYDNNLGIDDLSKSEFKIFPNPTSDFINVHLEESGDTKVSIIDGIGNIIRKQNFVENEFSVNVMNLNKNVYFIKLEREGKVLTRKFIKN